MSDAPGSDAGRLIACPACGNRVVRSARRCPACGARDPALTPHEQAPPPREPVRATAELSGATPASVSDEPDTAGAGRNAARSEARLRGPLLGFVLSALAGAAAAGLIAYLMWPAAPLPPTVAAPAPATPAVAPPAPAPAQASSPADASSLAGAPSGATVAPPPAATVSPQEAPAPSAAAPVGSRSRGRSDWLFFFKSGDRLARMSDDAPAGLVLRTERSHTFPDGTTGPAYLVDVPEGGQRFVDADELERGTRLQ
jgi:hypothetical protein